MKNETEFLTKWIEQDFQSQIVAFSLFGSAQKSAPCFWYKRLQNMNRHSHNPTMAHVPMQPGNGFEIFHSSFNWWQIIIKNLLFSVD
jgi:hypothetical protein